MLGTYQVTETKGNFMKKCLSGSLRYAVFLFAAFTLQLSADSSQQVRLKGHVPHNTLSSATYVKNLDAEKQVALTFTLPLRNQAELEQLIERMHNPLDHEHYGKYLSPDEFAARFAPTEESYQQLVSYVESLGLTVTGTHQNRVLLNVAGTTSTIEKAFSLNLHEYQMADGQTFHAPNDDPEVSGHIASLIGGVVGLDNSARWHTYHTKKESVDGFASHRSASHAFPSGPGGGYAPGDLVKAYNLSQVPTNGSGQVIALFELAEYQVSDINTYTNAFGLPQANLKNVIVDGGSNAGIDAEVTLDIELALALAPASQIYVYEGPNTNQGVLDTYSRIATDNIAKQVSTSWGLCETLVNSQYLQAENAIFLQMAAQGQTIYAAAGDSGAYDNYPDQTLAVDDPASQPYIVGVGGTTLHVDPVNGSYVSESVWDNGLGNGAGGGGVSKVWPIPSWQKNVPGVYSKTQRNIPDVALNSDTNTGYAIFHDGQWNIFGGTSCAAPLWAAFTALVNQERIANQKPSLGFANPILYAIGIGSSYSGNFHDITNGNNLFYQAGAGYDSASGLGSFIGATLFASLTNSTPPVPPPMVSPALNVTMTSSGHFKKGKSASYEIHVSNHGSGSTSGPVTVTISLPKGLSYHSFTGSGWSFNKKTMTCTQSTVLPAGSSYPSIVLGVTISKNAPSQVTTTATVSGGGSSSSKVTNKNSVK